MAVRPEPSGPAASPSGQLIFPTALSSRSEKVSELLVRQFVRDIAQGRLVPGTVLPPEPAMLNHLGVGRSTLREALRVLSIYGVIAMRPGPVTPVVEQVTSVQFARSSTLYFHLVGASLRHLLEARQVLSPLVARVAAGKSDRSTRQLLMPHVQRSSRSRSAELVTGVEGAEFHRSIGLACRNPILRLFDAGLDDLYLERLGPRTIPPEEARRIAREHEQIAEAIVTGQEQESERLMAAHMASYMGSVHQQYTTQLDDVLDWRSSEGTARRFELVARQIARSIAQGKIRPGTLMPPEAVLVEEFGVSRGTLREALRVLEVYGVIKIRAGRNGGPIVQQVDSHQFARSATLYFNLVGATLWDLLEARAVISPAVAGLAAVMADQQARAVLTENIAAAEAAWPGDTDLWRQLHTEFHADVARLSFNPILQMFDGAMSHLHDERLWRFEPNEAEARTTTSYHEEIAEAIINRDGTGASRLMAEHMTAAMSSAYLQHSLRLEDVLDWR